MGAQNLFHYNTFSIQIQPQTQTFIVTFEQEFITKEMTFELETFLSWLGAHLEIGSVVMQGKSNHFGRGLCPKEMSGCDADQLVSWLKRLQKITLGIQHLPQTFIANIENGAAGSSIEIAAACDIRLCTNKCSVEFNHLSKGLTMMAGAQHSLGQTAGPGRLRSWLLSSTTVDFSELQASGVILGLNDRLDSLLVTISKQSPLARIQTKACLLQTQIKQINHTNELSIKYGKASLTTGDYRKSVASIDESDCEFMKPRELKGLFEKAQRSAEEGHC